MSNELLFALVLVLLSFPEEGLVVRLTHIVEDELFDLTLDLSWVTARCLRSWLT